MIKTFFVTKLHLFLGMLFLTFMCSPAVAQDTNMVIVAIELESMNVFYLHIDNPIKIVVSEHKPSELQVFIDNGTITGSHGKYIIKPKELGFATVTIKKENEILKETTFRVKSNLTHRTALEFENGIYNRINQNHFTKSEMKKVIGLEFLADNSDFDFPFEIISFELVCVIDDSLVVSKSDRNKFTTEQKAIINSLKDESNFSLEDIKIKMPDGVRKLSSLSCSIKKD